MSQIRILFAEDSAFLRHLVQEKLEHAGFTVVAAVDGEDAWQRFVAAPESFDLLLTDIEMPKCSGIDLAARVRGSVRPRLPVVALTSLGTFQVLRRCVETGVDSFQVKFDFERLQAVIREFAGRSG